MCVCGCVVCVYGIEIVVAVVVAVDVVDVVVSDDIRFIHSLGLIF